MRWFPSGNDPDPPGSEWIDLIDNLNSHPRGGKWRVRFLGIWLPMVAVSYGTFAALTARAWTLNSSVRGFPSRHQGLLLPIEGPAAVSLGVMIICMGLFMHFQWYWGNHRKLDEYYEIGKYSSALGIVIAIVFHAFFMLSGNPVSLG